jgi:hypothetical protein
MTIEPPALKAAIAVVREEGMIIVVALWNQV